MRSVIMGIAIFSMLFVAATGFASEQEDAAKEATLTWLGLVDSGRYEASWEAASLLFRQQVSSPDWVRALATVRQPLGALKSRKLVSATYAETLPGAPDGKYVVLEFSAIYEHKVTAVETVTPLWDGDSWRVSGYYIK